MQQATSSDSRSPNPHVDPAIANGTNGTDGPQAHGPDGVPNWSNHAAKLRDGLNGHGKAHSPPSVGLRMLTGPERTGTPSNANISATPFDQNLGNFPYPSGAASALGPSTPAAFENGLGDEVYNGEWGNPSTEMWYLPPGPQFFQNIDSGAVAMTADGVSMGGMDLLDYMAMDPSQFPAIDGSTY
jgi:hypothetical protein